MFVRQHNYFLEQALQS